MATALCGEIAVERRRHWIRLRSWPRHHRCHFRP